MAELVKVGESSGNEVEPKRQTEYQSEPLGKRSRSTDTEVPPQKKSKVEEQTDGKPSTSMDHSSRASSVENVSSDESVQFIDLEVDELLDDSAMDAAIANDGNGNTQTETNGLDGLILQPTFDEPNVEIYESDFSIYVNKPANFKESPAAERIIKRYVLPGENFSLRFQYPNETESLLVNKCMEMHNILLRSVVKNIAQKNGHTFDPATQTFNFTVSLVFRHNRGGQLIDGSYVAPHIYEKDNIESIIRNFLVYPPESVTKSPGMEQMRHRLMSAKLANVASVFLGLPLWHRKRYQEIDPSHSLVECLRGKTLIDRPILLVILKGDIPNDNLKLATDEDWANTRRYVDDCSNGYFQGTPKHVLERLRQAELNRNVDEKQKATELLTMHRMNVLRQYTSQWQEIEKNPLEHIPTQQLVDILFVYCRYMVDGKRKATRRGFPSRLYRTIIVQLNYRSFKVGKLNLNVPPERIFLHYSKKQAPIAGVLMRMEFTGPQNLGKPRKERCKKNNRTMKQSRPMEVDEALQANVVQNSPVAIENTDAQIDKHVKQPLQVVKEYRPYGDAPRIIRKGMPYEIVQVDRFNFKDYREMQDMILLIIFRHNNDNVSAFRFSEMAAATELLLDTLEKYMDVKWGTDTSRSVSNYRVTTARVHMKRTSSIVTGGRGKSPHISRATDEANSNMMSALCFMMVIPFEMIVETMSEPVFDPKWVRVVTYACQERFRNLIALSESDEFKELHEFTGDFMQTLPAQLQDLYVQFMLRMRASGLQYWSTHTTITLPAQLDLPNLESYSGRFFRFISSKEHVHWQSITKDVVQLPTYLTECPIDEQSRFGEAPFEKGLIRNDIKSETFCPYTGSDRWSMSEVVMPEDPIVCLTARDCENRPFLDAWVDDINELLIVEIAKYWGKRVVRTHAIQKRKQASQFTWMHVCTVMFEGIPSFFFMGTGEHVQLRESRAVANSFIISSLCLMGIIPMELYTLIKTFGKEWIAPVLHGCRARFAEFEILMRNSFYFPLFNSTIARLFQDVNKSRCPLLPVAYEFYQRLRASGSTFWHANPVIPVPSDIQLPPGHLKGCYFSFIKSTDLTDWTLMVPPISEADTGRALATDRELSQYYATFQRDLKWKKSQVNNIYGVNNQEFKTAIEKCRVSEQTIGTLVVLRNILEKIAELCGSQLEEKCTFCSETELFDATIYFSGTFSAVFTSTASSSIREDAVNQSICTLARRLMQCCLLPYQLFPFVTNCFDRLPYVIPVLYPMVVKASAIIKEFVKSSLIKEDERETVVQLALSCIRKECRRDSQLLVYSIPSELVSANSLKQFSTISVRDLSDQDGWELKVKLAMNIGDSNGANAFARMPIHPAMPELNLDDMFIEESTSEPDPLEDDSPVHQQFNLPWVIETKEVKDENDPNDDDEYLD